MGINKRGGSRLVTNGELSALLGRDPSTISHTVRQFGIKPTRGGKYDLEVVKSAFEEKAKRDTRNAPVTDARRQKTVLECLILKERLAQIKRETIPVEEHDGELREVVEMVRDVFRQWRNYVSAVTKDGALVKKAEELEADMLKRLQSRFA